MRPFEELDGNPIWEVYCRQADRDPNRINLTDLWRASGRKRGWSPRQYARMWDREITFVGSKADDPAYADKGTANHYIQMLDWRILDAHGKAVMGAIRQDPVGMLLSSCKRDDVSDGTGPNWITAMLVSSTCAVDGSRTEGDARLIEAAIEKTRDLSPFEQETVIAKVQRALGKAREITTGRVIDGKFVEDQ